MDERIDDAANERAWLRRIADGDRSAFEAFFRAYERRVYRYLTQLLADDGLANEVASDVMVEVWRCAPRYAGRSKPSTWALGIAHHKAIDVLRRSRREVFELRLAEQIKSDAGDPELHAIESSTRAQIDAALARLRPEHRAVLHLTFVLGYPQADIAAIVDCPLGTVKTRVFHAKRALRAALVAAGLEREVS